jgi:hypothetical protein
VDSTIPKISQVATPESPGWPMRPMVLSSIMIRAGFAQIQVLEDRERARVCNMGRHAYFIDE